MLNICKHLFEEWNSSGVRYCHWKSNEHLEDGLNGFTDLDVYVYIDDMKLAQGGLEGSDFIKCVPLKANIYPDVEEWIGFDNETGSLLHVHLHFQIITGTKFCKEYVFPVDELIISTRIIDANTGVYITAPELELLLLYCRIGLKSESKRRIIIDEDSKKEVCYLKERYNHQALTKLCDNLFKSKSKIVLSFIEKETLRQEDWSVFMRIIDDWLHPYKKMNKCRVWLRHYYYKYRSLAVLGINKYFNTHLICRKVFPQDGLIVCCIGQDGSGKSTTTINLCKWLNWKVEASRFYLGSGDHYHSLFKSFQEGVAPKMKETISVPSLNTETVKTSRGNATRKIKVLRWVSMMLSCINLVYLAKRSYKQARNAKKYSQKGGVALFDRYPQVQFEGLYDGPKIRYNYIRKGRSNSIVRFLCRKEEMYLTRAQTICPHLYFKLVLPVEETMRRKPEENYENVCLKHEITEKLEFPNSDVYVIDATQEYSRELLEIKRIIWNKILKMR